MKNIVMFFCFSFFLQLEAFPQDSFQELSQEISGLSTQEKIEKLSNECWTNRSKNPHYAIECGTEALKLAKQVNDYQNVAQNLNFLGVVYRNMGSFPKALDYYQEALAVADSINDSTQIAYSYNNIGGINRIERRYSAAYQDMHQALKIFEKMGNKEGIAFCTINIGILFRYQKHYDKALDYLSRTIAIREEIGDNSGRAIALNQVAEIYLSENNLEKAEAVFNSLIEIYSDLGDKKGIAVVYGGLASVASVRKDYRKALDYRSKALDINFEISNSEGIVNNLNKMAIIHTRLGNNVIGESLLNKSYEIASKPEHKVYMLDYYWAGSICSELTGEYDQALHFYKMYSELKDSLAAEENILTATNLEAIYQTEKAIEEKELSEHQSELKERQRNYLFLIVLLLAILIAYVTYKYFHNKRITSELRELNATKDKLYSIVAHDLKSPFNSLIGFTDVLVNYQDTMTEEERKKALSGLNASSKRLVRLVENLLEWARNNLGSLKYSPKKLLLVDLVKNVVNIYDDLLEEKSIVLKQDIDGSIAPYCDEQFLKIVLRNLLSNAIKFSSEGGVIEITSERKGSGIEISVADHGVGIPIEKHEKLFKLGEDVSTKGTKDETGTGLGLILCADLVAKWGGEIFVDSKPGTGSKFTITIPNIPA